MTDDRMPVRVSDRTDDRMDDRISDRPDDRPDGRMHDRTDDRISDSTSDAMDDAAPDAPETPDSSSPLLGHVVHHHNHHPKSALARHLARHVSRRRADLVLLLCYTVTGLLDSSAISVWGSFVSMQTGNTIYLGLGVARASDLASDSTRWVKALAALASFSLGSFLFSRYHRRFSPRRRWVLCLSFAAQALLCAAAALVVALVPPAHRKEVTWRAVLPVAVVAFQSSGQAVTSRVMDYPVLNSVVLTNICCDLFSDQRLFARDNVNRNRRVAAPVFLLVGAIAGGLFAHSSVGIAGALWTAAGLKAVILVAWLAWPASEGRGN